MLGSRIIIGNRAGVNHSGRVCRFTSVNRIGRSLGCTNRPAHIRVNSHGHVHRDIAVRHNAIRNNKLAGINDSGLLVVGTRVTRSYAMNGHYVLTGGTALTNRMSMSSFTVVNNVATIRRFYVVNTRIVINNYSNITRSIPPCIVTRNGRTAPFNIGVRKLGHHKFDHRTVATVHGTCGLVCHDNGALSRIGPRVTRLTRACPRIGTFASFFTHSAHNLVHW